MPEHHKIPSTHHLDRWVEVDSWISNTSSQSRLRHLHWNPAWKIVVSNNSSFTIQGRLITACLNSNEHKGVTQVLCDFLNILFVYVLLRSWPAALDIVPNLAAIIALGFLCWASVMWVSMLSTIMTSGTAISTARLRLPHSFPRHSFPRNMLHNGVSTYRYVPQYVLLWLSLEDKDHSFCETAFTFTEKYI